MRNAAKSTIAYSYIAALGFILFTDSDIEYVASIPFKRIERCVGDIKAIPAL